MLGPFAILVCNLPEESWIRCFGSMVENMNFHWPSFAIGAAIVAAIVIAFPFVAPLLSMRMYNAIYGVFMRRKFQKRPARIKSPSDLQPFLKALAQQQEEATLFVRSEAPEFTIRISNKVYKKRPSVLILEIRNVDANRDHYEAACEALQNQGPDFEEILSPKKRKRSRARIRVEHGTFASSAIVSAVGAVFDSAGVKKSTTLLVSEVDPCLWPET